MNYPKILDRNGNQLAILNNIFNPVIKEQINGEYTFSFVAIIEELKTDYVHYDNVIEIENNLFQISKYKKYRTSENKLLIDVFCEQVSYKLIDDKLDDFIREDQTAQEMLSNVLIDTDFNLKTVSAAGTNTVKIDNNTNVREVLNKIGNIFAGEYIFDKYDISFVAQRGTNRGVEFRVGKNLKGISKEVDATVKDENGNPKVTYEVEILELNELEDFKGLEGFAIGDTIRIIDSELSFDVNARIFEIEYNPLLKKNTRVVLGNFIENIANSYIDFRIASNLVSSRSNIWDRSEAINENKTISTEILEGEINAGSTAINAGLGTVRVTQNNGILITDQPTEENSTKALRLLGGTLAISNEKDVNSNWVWRTFGTGDGFVADEIITGTLLTSLVRIIGNPDIPNSFFWDETGLHVYKINIDNSIDNNQYILLDNEGLKFTQDGGNTWLINLRFDGLKATHLDGSYTTLDGHGINRVMSIPIYESVPSGTDIEENFDSTNLEALGIEVRAMTEINGWLVPNYIQDTSPYCYVTSSKKYNGSYSMYIKNPPPETYDASAPMGDPVYYTDSRTRVQLKSYTPTQDCVFSLKYIYESVSSNTSVYLKVVDVDNSSSETTYDLTKSSSWTTLSCNLVKDHKYEFCIYVDGYAENAIAEVYVDNIIYEINVTTEVVTGYEEGSVGYNYLTWVGEGTADKDGITITLPYWFKGLNYNVFLSFRQISRDYLDANNLATTYVKSQLLEVDSINNKIPGFNVKGYAYCYVQDIGTTDQTTDFVPVDFTYTVTVTN